MTLADWKRAVASLKKPSRLARRKKEHKAAVALVSAEELNKRKVRKRDGRCRFPLCGCNRLKLRLEVSHVTHKGMGGNPTGDRSLAAIMVLLCVARHQESIISRHKGTLRARYLTDQGFNGPVAWEVDINRLRGDSVSMESHWVTVATETSIGIFHVFTDRQLTILKALRELDR